MNPVESLTAEFERLWAKNPWPEDSVSLLVAAQKLTPDEIDTYLAHPHAAGLETQLLIMLNGFAANVRTINGLVRDLEAGTSTYVDDRLTEHYATCEECQEGVLKLLLEFLKAGVDLAARVAASR